LEEDKSMVDMDMAVNRGIVAAVLELEAGKHRDMEADSPTSAAIFYILLKMP